ncbi:MAG: hypothetical protein QG646_2170 [Euryarchaeota archaeon]|nr:hypothetical protein [Euryarchaeota archaeon]
MSLAENDIKIFSCSGSTVLITLYKFTGLLFLKGLCCEHDFQNYGRKFALGLKAKKH